MTQVQAMTETKAEQKEPKEKKNTKENQDNKKNMKKSRRIKPGLFIGLIVVLGTAAVLYFAIGSTYQKVFFPATTVNGINVSGLTPEQAQETVNTVVQEYILTLEEADEITEQISGSDIGLCITDTGFLQDLLGSQNIVTWGFEFFSDKEYSLETGYDEEKLRSAINSLS